MQRVGKMRRESVRTNYEQSELLEREQPAGLVVPESRKTLVERWATISWSRRQAA